MRNKLKVETSEISDLQISYGPTKVWKNLMFYYRGFLLMILHYQQYKHYIKILH